MKNQNFFKQQTIRLAAPQNEGEPHLPIRTPIFHPGQLPTNALTMQVWGVLCPTPEAMAAEQIGNFRAMLSFTDDQHALLNINWEQVPNEDSTITLDKSQTVTVFGQPVVRLDWNLLEQEKRTIKKGLAMCQQYFKERGATGFQIQTDLSGGPEDWTFAPPQSPSNPPAPSPPQNWIQAGDHHMGAMRMSADAQDGIVDPNLKAHSLDNLYIVSTGVWPTSGYANPTLTLVALALRLGDHLKAKPV